MNIGMVGAPCAIHPAGSQFLLDPLHEQSGRDRIPFGIQKAEESGSIPVIMIVAVIDDRRCTADTFPGFVKQKSLNFSVKSGKMPLGIKKLGYGSRRARDESRFRFVPLFRDRLEQYALRCRLTG